MSEVNFINIPAYAEIGVKHTYAKALQLPGMADLFGDKLPKNKTCDKVYFYNCFNTLYPKEVEALVKHANNQRYKIDNDKVQENTITITDEWAKELEEQPFVSKQRGRMAHLLKKKSKVGVEHASRVTYQPYDFQKRPRHSADQQTQGIAASQS